MSWLEGSSWSFGRILGTGRVNLPIETFLLRTLIAIGRVIFTFEIVSLTLKIVIIPIERDIVVIGRVILVIGRVIITIERVMLAWKGHYRH